MNAGKMDRKIVLLAYGVTTDNFGQEVDSYTDAATVWAEKKDLSAMESVEVDQLTATVRTEFRIRYRTDVRATWRIRYDGEVYAIRGILEIGRREGLVLITEKKDSVR